MSTWTTVGVAVVAGMFIFLRILVHVTTKREIESRKIMFSGPHERRKADLAEFPGLDVAMYERTTAELEALGFTVLGDVEDMTLARTMVNPRAPGRYLLSADGTVHAGILQLRFSPLIRIMATLFAGRNPDLVMMQMRFTDGSVLIAQRCSPKLVDHEPPEITAVAVDPHHSLAEMHEAVTALLAARPDLVPVPMRSLDDVLETDRYIDALRREYRLKVGLHVAADLLRQGMDGQAAKQEIARLNKYLVGDPEWDPALKGGDASPSGTENAP